MDLKSTKPKSDYADKSAAEISKMNEKSSSLGTLLVLVGIIIAIVTLLVTIFEDYSYWMGIVLGLLVAGVGEIIILLNKIYLNTKQ